LLVDNHGVIALSISNIMRNVFGLFGVVTWAIGGTTNAMVSNLIGQQKQDHVWELLIRIIKISTTFSVVVAILVNIFPTVLLSIYGQSHEFIEQGVPVLRVVSVAMVLMSFSVVFLNAVVGSGNTKITLMIEAFTLVFYCLYAWIVLDRYFLSITWGWMCEWLYWILMFIPSFLYMKSGKWQGKTI
jgi:Na+-driven multidrug efflux pump